VTVIGSRVFEGKCCDEIQPCLLRQRTHSTDAFLLRAVSEIIRWSRYNWLAESDVKAIRIYRFRHDRIDRLRPCGQCSTCIWRLLLHTGAVHINECPRERFIPIYLVVGGTTTLALQLVMLIMNICSLCKKSNAALVCGVCTLVFAAIASLFSIAWFIAGETFACINAKCNAIQSVYLHYRTLFYFLISFCFMFFLFRVYFEC